MPSTESVRTYNRRDFLKMIIGIKGEGNDVSLFQTARLAAAVGTAMMATTPIADAIERDTPIIMGNRKGKEIINKIRKDPLLAFVNASLLAPFVEETFFRGLPSCILLAFGRLGTMWKVGIPTSLIFAAAHNLDKDSSTDKMKLYTDAIPAYQFASGIFQWKMMRERGYLHAILAHSVLNTIPFFYILFIHSSTEGKIEKMEQLNCLTS